MLRGHKWAHTVERGTLMGTCDRKGHSDEEYHRKGHSDEEYHRKGHSDEEYDGKGHSDGELM
ncbi:unnamed protein product [Staurois parvus]|uniref:Uncharacterized protein n=1 Tax=Staurois parvus TaxID=386267 RepID=A0ABN9H0Q0_9NEOB|nr:unnamed protein product [Staurois parvus]